VAGGLVNGPTGFTFDDAGNMIVAAQASGQIIQINADKSMQILLTLSGASGVARYGQGWLVGSGNGVYLTNAQWQSPTQLNSTRGDNFLLLPNGIVAVAGYSNTGFYQIVPVPAVGNPSGYNNLALTTPANLMLASSVIDSTGAISQVSFFNGSALLGTATQAPYTFNWSNIAPGNYTITAQTTDSLGNAGISVPIDLTVTASPTGASQSAQTIGFATPANTMEGSAPFVLSATASSGLPVAFSVNTVGVCSVVGSTVTLNGAGTCTITANQMGNGSYYAAPMVTQSFVVAPIPLAINLTSPAVGQTWTAPATIPLVAVATKPDTTTIAQVEFFNGTTSLGKVASSPYYLNWTNVLGGVYSISATVTDNAGGIATSLPVAVTVGPVISLTKPSANQTLMAPAKLTLTAQLQSLFTPTIPNPVPVGMRGSGR
jgi:hypothetical protein